MLSNIYSILTENSYVVLFLLIILFSVILFFNIKRLKKIKQVINQCLTQNKIEKKEINIDINECSALKKFLYDLIEDKFKYRLYKDILPFYIKNKKLDKNQINKLKENIFFEVRITLAKPIKQKLLKCFTKDGLDLMINEYVLILLNKIDLKFYQSDENIENFTKII